MVNQRVFVSWLPVAIAVTIALGTVYAAVQQNYRESANDPQIQLAEDISAMLRGGLEPKELAGSIPPVDIANSLATFVMVFDAQGKASFSSGFIGSSSPALPEGVLSSTRSLGINDITWELPSGERFAAVVKYWKGSSSGEGFVLAARSLREIEEREFRLELIVGIGWIMAMILTLVAEWFKLLYHRRYIKDTYIS
ncbi:MAG: hypothetical protein WCV79_03025 [Candidatus Paceibacterota bacterium]